MNAIASGTVLITGPTGGLGKATTLAIANRPAEQRPDLLLVGRPGTALTEVAEAARAAGATVQEIGCDLARLADVRDAARQVKDLLAAGAVRPLRAIVANAGVSVADTHNASADGYELTFAVNHLAHAQLIGDLLDSLTEPAKVVLLASYTYENVRMMLLSKSKAFPNGLANNHDQVGKHYIGHWANREVTGLFPVDLNIWYGANAQGVVVNNWAEDNFDHSGLGFIRGAQISVAPAALEAGPEQLEHAAGAGAEIEERAKRLVGERRLHLGLDRLVGDVQRAGGAHLGEPLAIARDHRVALVEPPDQRTHRERSRPVLGEAEERPGALAKTGHQPGLGQELEMAGDARLRLAQDVGQLRDRQLGLVEQRQDAQPRLLAGRLERRVEIVEADQLRHGWDISQVGQSCPHLAHIKICLCC